MLTLPHRRLSGLLLLWLLLSPSCAAPSLADPAEFLPTRTGRLQFRYQRGLDQGSFIRGKLTVVVAAVTQPVGPGQEHGIRGDITKTTEGYFTTRKAAQDAPQEAVQAAMDPTNVKEVFEVKKLGKRSSMTRIHWDRLGSLRLPIKAAENTMSSPFDSRLRGAALNDTTEVAMLWHKPLITFFQLPPFGTFTLTGVQMEGEVAVIQIAQSLGAGQPLRFTYRIARGGRLVGFVIHYRDGTTLRAETLPGQ